MKNKKILALTLAATIASGGASQMAMQVYADDESSISESSSTAEPSSALPLERVDMPNEATINTPNGAAINTPNRATIILPKEFIPFVLSYSNEKNMFMPINNQSVFEINNPFAFEPVDYYGTSGSVDIPQEACIGDQAYNAISIVTSAFENKREQARSTSRQLIFEIINESEVELVQYYGTAESVDIPQRVCIDDQEYDVTSIGDDAFTNKENLKFINLPDSITLIGQEAFKNCTNLQLTKLPDNLTEIGEGAFHNCANLKLTKLPDNLTDISAGAFENCANLKLTKLPDNVTMICESAFYNCTKLQLTKLPDNLTEIHLFAFYNCTNLQLTKLPDSLIEIQEAAFKGCTNLKLTELPKDITKIPKCAFCNCPNLKLTKLPNNVTKIGDNAFYNTNIESIDIPASVTKLGEDSFLTPSIKVINTADNSKLTNDDLIRACGRYFRQTNLAQYLKNPVFRQIEKDEIIDEPCPICCCDLEFNANDDNDNNIADLPFAESHHYMHRDCYNEIQERLEEAVKNDKRELLIHRKIADGISEDIAEKEAEEAIEELDNEIQEETLEELMAFLAGKKRDPSN